VALVLILPVYVVAAITLIVLVVYGAAISRLMSVRVRPMRRLRAVESELLESDVRELLHDYGQRLVALGFERCGAAAEDYLVEGVDEPFWSLLYRDVEGTTIARITLAESPTRMQPVDLAFYSSTRDDCVIETVAWRVHRIAPGLPGHILIDAQTLSWEEQWECHRRGLAEHAAPILLDPETLTTRLAAFRNAAERFELDEGRYVPKGDGSLRFGLQWAYQTVMRANRGERNRLRALAQAEKADAPGIADGATEPARSLAPDLAAHRRREAIEQVRRTGWVKKLVFFGISMLLFALAFGIQVSPRMLILLIGILFFHELGHVLAMRFFGYKDLQILFIPFLGAVASGKKESVASWQEVVVLLAGPVPGILVGTLILSTGWGVENLWVRDCAQLMLFVNYLNLLPIVPLDGGRVMSIAFFDRFPRVQFVFSAASALAVIGVGIWLGEMLISCIGLVLLAGVPRQLVQVRTVTKVKEALQRRRPIAPASEGADPIPSIYRELQAERFDRWNSEAKFQFVRHIREALERQTASLRVAFASVTAYCAVVFLPVGLITYTYVPPEKPAIVAEAETAAPDDAEDGTRVATAEDSSESAGVPAPLTPASVE
jgi:Zn-dependent protease